jgi:hypothetical protein
LADIGQTQHIYVAGNHEYYHHDIEILDNHLFELAEKSKLNYLQRTSVVIQGVRFLGCTLWTDFNIQPGLAVWCGTGRKSIFARLQINTHAWQTVFSHDGH